MLSSLEEDRPMLSLPYAWQSEDSVLPFLKRQKLGTAHQVARQRVFEHSSVLKKPLWECNTLNGGTHSFTKFCTRLLKEASLLFNKMDTSFYTKILNKPHRPGNLSFEAQSHNHGS